MKKIRSSAKPPPDKGAVHIAVCGMIAELNRIIDEIYHKRLTEVPI